MDSSFELTMVGLVSVLSEITIKGSNYSYVVNSNFNFTNLSKGRLIKIIDKSVSMQASLLNLGDDLSIYLDAIEKQKDLNTVGQVLEQLSNLGANKEDCLIVIGGGVMQDIATMAASLYMRGLNWVYVPTTLMSMIDSCIGGKSSINLNNFKNRLGNFYPPKQVVIDIEFLKTLSKLDIASGLAEGMKICYAYSSNDALKFQTLVKKWQDTQKGEFIRQAIFLSLNRKKHFIEIDEFDKKERKILNFGHSFGHALEASTNFTLPHGVAVLIGMQAAIIHSGNKEPCKTLSIWIEDQATEIATLLKKFELSKSRFTEAIKIDKKNSSLELNLILPNSAGNLELVQSSLSDSNLNICFESIVASLEQLGFAYEVF